MIEDLMKKYDGKCKELLHQVTCLDKESCDTFGARLLLTVYREFLVDLQREQEKQRLFLQDDYITFTK